MAGPRFRIRLTTTGLVTDPISLKCKEIMTQNYLICKPSRKKKVESACLDRTMFGIKRRIRSVEPQFHDDCVFTGAVVIPSQTPFFEIKFSIKLPRRQI